MSSLSQSQILYRNFQKLALLQFQSKEPLKVQTLFNELIQLEQSRLPTQSKGHKKFIDTNNSYFQPATVQLSEISIKKPNFNAEYVPKSLFHAKLDKMQLISSIKINALLKSDSVKLNNFQLSIFNSLKNLALLSEQVFVFKILVDTYTRPQKIKQLHNSFSDCLMLKLDSISNQQNYELLTNWFEACQICTEKMIQLLGQATYRAMRKNNSSLPRGFQILNKLLNQQAMRQYALKSILLLDSDELVSVIQNLQFSNTDLQVTQDAVDIKLKLINQETVEKLPQTVRTILLLCFLCPHNWNKLFQRSVQFNQVVWNALRAKLSKLHEAQDIVLSIFSNIKIQKQNANFKSILFDLILKLYQARPAFLKEHIQLFPFIASQLLLKVNSGQDISSLANINNIQLLAAGCYNKQVWTKIEGTIMESLRQIKKYDKVMFQKIIENVLSGNYFLDCQQRLPALIQNYSQAQMLNFLKEISKKQHSTNKWFAAIVLCVWLNPNFKSLKSQILTLLNSVIKRKDGGQTKRGVSKLWTLLRAEYRKALMKGLSEQENHFQHLYLQ